jgi:hypothetical protein
VTIIAAIEKPEFEEIRREERGEREEERREREKERERESTWLRDNAFNFPRFYYFTEKVCETRHGGACL